jgi:hypothetical protein
VTTSSVKINSQKWAELLGVPVGTSVSETEFHNRSFSQVNKMEYNRYLKEGMPEEKARKLADKQTAQAKSQMNKHSRAHAVQMAQESDED